MESVSFILMAGLEIGQTERKKQGMVCLEKRLSDGINFMIFILLDQYIIKSRFRQFLKKVKRKGNIIKELLFLSVSLEYYMKENNCRLPPLPKRISEGKEPLLNCRSIPIQRKYSIAENQAIEDELVEPVLKPLAIRQRMGNNQRPDSNHSKKSIESRRPSYDSKQSIRVQSYEGKRDHLMGQAPPKVTAKSWIIFQMQQGKMLWSHRSHKRREMASLTKMMNLVTVLDLMERMGLDAKRLKVKASQTCCQITGTTAELSLGRQYTLSDLYYGMMLPSGNDAAYLIAEVSGFIIKTQGRLVQHQVNQVINDQIARNSWEFVDIFLKEMNRIARQIDMFESNFANPHGLSNINNYSTASDLAKLSQYAMNKSLFRRIVQTRKHSYTLEQSLNKQQCITSTSLPLIEQQKENLSPENINPCDKMCNLFWQNTNRMLGEGWSGIKTGVTPNAGPCLAASLSKVLEGKKCEFLVILLNSESMEARWGQVRSLVQWAISKRRYL